MSRAIPRPKVTLACLQALSTAERKYARWSGGTTMRAAPESLVQAILAEELAKLGSLLRLESSVKSLVEDSGIPLPPTLPRNESGRIDVALYFKSKKPRFIIEVKKITHANSLNDDRDRILDLLSLCPNIQNGIMLGYATAPDGASLDALIDRVRESSRTKIVRRMAPTEVQGKNGMARFLAGAVFRVDIPAPGVAGEA